MPRDNSLTPVTLCEACDPLARRRQNGCAGSAPPRSLRCRSGLRDLTRLIPKSADQFRNIRRLRQRQAQGDLLRLRVRREDGDRRPRIGTAVELEAHVDGDGREASGIRPAVPNEIREALPKLSVDGGEAWLSHSHLLTRRPPSGGSTQGKPRSGYRRARRDHRCCVFAGRRAGLNAPNSGDPPSRYASRYASRSSW